MKYILSILLLFMLFACKDEKEKSFMDLFPNVVETPMHDSKYLLKDSLGDPDILFSIGDFIIFSEPKMPELLMCYNTKTSTLQRMLNKGQGADEAIKIQILGKGMNPSSFYALDVLTDKIFQFTIDGNYIKYCGIDHELPKHSFCSISYDDSMAIFTNINHKKRFTIRNGKIFSDFGENIKIPGLTPEVVSHSLQGISIINTTQKRIAWFSVYGNIMEIYDYSNLFDIKLIKSVVMDLPIFASNEPGVMNIETKVGVTSVVSDGNYIYALYNGKTLKEIISDRGNAFFTDKILIWDWNGKPLKILNLDRPVKSITYNNQKNAIICLALDENLNNNIYEFSHKE